MINAVDNTTSATLYPVMVGAAGSDQLANVTTTKLSFNASTGQLAVTGTGNALSVSGNAVITGDTTLGGTLIETVTTNAAATGSVTIDLAVTNVHDLTLTGAITTLTISNAPAAGKAQSVTLILRQGTAATSYSVAWPASFNWSSAEAPTLCTGANKLDVITFITVDGGTKYFAAHAMANVSY